MSRNECIDHGSSDLLQSYSSLHAFFSQRSVAKYIQVSQGRNLMVTLTPPLLVPKIKPIFKQGFSVLSPIHLSCLLPSPKPWLTPMLTPDLFHWLPNSYSPSSNLLFMLQAYLVLSKANIKSSSLLTITTVAFGLQYLRDQEASVHPSNLICFCSPSNVLSSHSWLSVPPTWHTHSCLWAFALAVTSACDILPTPSFIPNLTWPSGINLDVLHSCVYIFKEGFCAYQCFRATQCDTMLSLGSFLFFSLLFYFFKLWKDDNTFTRNLENTDQWYI